MVMVTNNSSKANQVNTLVYCMGDEADDMLCNLFPSVEQTLDMLRKGTVLLET